MDQNKAEVQSRDNHVLLRRKVDENYFFLLKMAIIGMWLECLGWFNFTLKSLLNSFSGDNVYCLAVEPSRGVILCLKMSRCNNSKPLGNNEKVLT